MSGCFCAIWPVADLLGEEERGEEEEEEEETQGEYARDGDMSRHNEGKSAGHVGKLTLSSRQTRERERGKDENA